MKKQWAVPKTTALVTDFSRCIFGYEYAYIPDTVLCRSGGCADVNQGRAVGELCAFDVGVYRVGEMRAEETR